MTAATVAGRVEAAFACPGETLIATNSGGGPTNVTIPAGSYFPTDFVATIAARLNAVRTPATWTVTLDPLSGLTTVNWTGSGNFTLNFAGAPNTMTTLGFTGILSGITAGLAQTGPNAHRFLWIPNHPLNSDVDSKQSPTENDMRQVESPLGTVTTLVGTDKTVHTGLEWSHVQASRAWISEETTPNQSYERFYLDAIRGNGHAWSAPNLALKIYDHRAVQLGTNKSWKLSGPPTLADLRMTVQGFVTYVGVKWPRLVSG